MSEPSPRRRAVVTGASSGIGEAFAERLAADGHDLVVVARRADRLAALKQRLEDASRVQVEPLVADLAEPAGIAAAEERVAAWRPEVLVNNAGFAGYRAFTEQDVDVLQRLVHVHVLCTVRLAHAALPAMLERGAGAVIDVASLLALSGPLGSRFVPGRATYAGAKSFLLTFTQALADEVKERGVQAMVVLPGMVDTEFHGSHHPLRGRAGVVSPEEVVTAALAGLEHGETVCVPGLEDASLLDDLTEHQRAILQGGNSGGLASRYRTRT